MKKTLLALLTGFMLHLATVSVVALILRHNH